MSLKNNAIQLNNFMKCKLNKCYKEIIAIDIEFVKIMKRKEKYINKMKPVLDKLYENSTKKSNQIKIKKFNNKIEKMNKAIIHTLKYKKSMECIYKNCRKNYLQSINITINGILKNVDKKNKNYKRLLLYKKELKTPNIKLNKLNKIMNFLTKF
jgi:hypothetical protein